MENNSKTILTFLLGAAAGVAIGYFLASDNKEEIINDLSSTAKRVKENIEGGVEKGKQFVDDMKNKVNDLLEQA